MSVNTSEKTASILAKLFGLKLSTQISMMMAFMVLGFAAAGIYGDQSYEKVTIGGPVFSEIVANKDLTADILPPPAYLIESWQVALGNGGN